MAVTIIYQAATTLKKLRLNTIGKTLIGLSLLSLIFLISLPQIAKLRSQSLPQPSSPNYFKTLSQKTLSWEMLNNFQLIIPKLNLNVKVKESIDPFNSDTWQSALKTGVAHALGSAFPDEAGTVYIFGHSTDYPWNIEAYNALFYSLNDLNTADQIDLSYHNQIYHYRIVDKQIIAADDTSFLYSTDNRLILQTCWPPGTTLKRLIVIAQPVDF